MLFGVECYSALREIVWMDFDELRCALRLLAVRLAAAMPTPDSADLAMMPKYEFATVIRTCRFVLTLWRRHVRRCGVSCWQFAARSHAATPAVGPT